jgi:hypothetical protein
MTIFFGFCNFFREMFTESSQESHDFVSILSYDNPVDKAIKKLNYLPFLPLLYNTQAQGPSQYGWGFVSF